MTGPSASWGTGTVTGKYLSDIDGTALGGTVTFTIPVRIVSAVDGVIFPATPAAGGTKTVALDGSGSFTTTLGGTDDPDINPTGWQYLVKENVPGGQSYYLSVPVGSTINLDTIVTPDMFTASTSSKVTGPGAAGFGVYSDSRSYYFDTAAVLGSGATITVDVSGVPYITV